MNTEENKLNLANERLDNRLKVLRNQIKHKTRNAQDLEKLFQQDYDRIRKLPKWFILLTVMHFLIVMHAWSIRRVAICVVNIFMFLWCHRRFYREVHAVVTPLSIFVILLSSSFE